MVLILFFQMWFWCDCHFFIILFNWSLLVWVFLYDSSFQYVLECYQEDLSLCVCPTDSRGSAWLLFVMASLACCSWWSVSLPLLCILCMISSPLSTTVPWVHSQPSLHWSATVDWPYWNKSITSGVSGSYHFCLSIYQCFIMFIIIGIKWQFSKNWHDVSYLVIKQLCCRA